MDSPKHYSDYPLSPMTSFKTGGNADEAVIVSSDKAFHAAVEDYGTPDWVVGFGSNALVSDKGLPGRTFIFRGGSIEAPDETLLVADAGVWWDNLVQSAVQRKLWGLECTSMIPGSVGAAVVGNIAAYGQAVADTLEWAEVYDVASGTTQRYEPGELGLVYRASTVLQNNRNLIVLRAAFRLNTTQLKPLEYESALSQARTYGFDTTTLEGIRKSIAKAREVAGSLWDYRDETASKTAGSFFRNPLVDSKTAETIMSYDESGTSLELLKKMNRVHGGADSRVSAAHVLLAAGFKRGQSWGPVRLHPQHVLKIENTGTASSQDIYKVAHEIMTQVKNRLGVTIEPEIRFLGEF